MWKTIKRYTIGSVILALAATSGYLYLFPRREGTVRRLVDPPGLVEKIQQLNELVTVKYGVQKIIGLEEEKVPFGSEKLLLMVHAEVLAGVNLAQLSAADVTVDSTNAVTVRLPPPTVLHVYVNEKETQTWDRKKTWWTPWVGYNPELEKKTRLAALEAVQVTALEMGILRDAQRNAETSIRGVLEAAGVEAVKFAEGGEVLPRDASD